MQLNLPILDLLANSQKILIAGAGGGFDIYAGLPIYFTLRALGKEVHLANYSFSPLELLHHISDVVVIDENLMGTRGGIQIPFTYYPEGYLSQWFKECFNEEVIIWMFPNKGVIPVRRAYAALLEKLHFDALILVDGGVDSLMRGDEEGAGTLIEDAISLAAVEPLDVPIKILACIGFGTEVEEAVCHYLALANIAELAKEDAFLGACALTTQMPAFQLYEAASRYVWEQPKHVASHISTRIIPAVHGEFGNYQMYPMEKSGNALISPLMSLYWFFDANAVTKRSLCIPALQKTVEKADAFHIFLRMTITPRRCQKLPY